MPPRVLVLGAGFGGLELTTILSDACGDDIEVTLIDRSDHFVFGFSKLDVMFGRATPDAVRLHYRNIVKPGVRFRQETITAIDPAARRVVTTNATYEADFLVVALGADYEPEALPGLTEGANEFYSVAGATRLRDVIPAFTRGRAIVAVTSTPFKCPPAPSEAALMLHDYLTARGLRDGCDISIVMPFGAPIPPSPAASKALLAAFAERNINWLPDRLVRRIDPARKTAVLGDGTEMEFDLFLGVPPHRVPTVVAESGMTEDGWIPVDPGNLKTRFPRVYAVGDVTSVGTPKAGVFAEGAARVAAASILAEIRDDEPPSPYGGAGSCYVEFGDQRVARVDVEFRPGTPPTGSFFDPSTDLAREKEEFGATRRTRWFGL
jgi:sulfide:quinone oxidoreductase